METSRTMTGLRVPPAGDAPPPPPSFWMRWRLPLMLALVAAVAFGLVTVSRLITSETPGIELTLEGRLALLPFLDATGTPTESWVEQGLMRLVAETLERSPGASVVPPKRLDEVLGRRTLDPADPGARERARRIVAGVGGRLVLDAAVRLERRGYAIDFEVFAGSDSVAAGELEGEDLLELADTLAYALARGFGGRDEPARLRRTFSRSPFVDRLYATGLQALETGGAGGAARYFEIALEHQPGFLQARAALARCARELGDLEQARELAAELLQEAQSRADRRLQAVGFEELGRLAGLDGRFGDALEFYTQALTIHRDDGAQASEDAALFELARLALAEGADQDAEAFLTQRLVLKDILDDRLGRAETLSELAALKLSDRDFDAAGAALDEARRIAAEVGDPWTEMRVVASLGELAQSRGKRGEALDHWRDALAFFETQGDERRRLILSRKLAEALLVSGEWDAAEDRLQDALELARKLGDEAVEARSSLGLAWLLLRTGYPLQSRPFLDRALELDRHMADDRFTLQLVIAWSAYEQGNYRLAYTTQLEARRQTADAWRGMDESILRVYEQAVTLGERRPLPWEEGYVAPPQGIPVE